MYSTHNTLEDENAVGVRPQADAVAVAPAAEMAPPAEHHEEDLASQKTAAAQKIAALRADLEGVVAAARARGENPPQLQDVDALNTDATSINTSQDMAMLTAKLDSADRGIRGEQGKQMLQQVGDAALTIAGGTAMVAGGLGISQLAAAGLPEDKIRDIGKSLRGQGVTGGEHTEGPGGRASEISKEALAAGALLLPERSGQGRQLGDTA